MYRAFADSPSQKSLAQVFLQNDISLYLKGTVGSGLNFRLAEAFEQHQKTVLLVCEDREKAAYHLNDLEQLLGQETVLFFPLVTVNHIKPKRQTMPTYSCVRKC